MLAYHYDQDDIHDRVIDFLEHEAVPRDCLLEPVPALTGTEVAQRVGMGWVVLPERPQPQYNGPPLEQVYAAKIQEILTGATACAKTIKSRYSELEVDSWSEQRQQAEKVLAGDTLPADALIAVLAATNGVPIADFAQRIMSNVTTAEQVTKAVVSQQQAFELIIKSIVADETMDDTEKVTAITDIVVTYDLEALHG